ncbi:MAG: 50S ribosomal protein L6 [Planctomycetes bacterium]|nr:50S ribosomal protein L6 [Planctomycetota bacterium]
MSRIGKQPVVIPPGVNVERTKDRQVKVKGAKGELAITLRPEVDVEIKDGKVFVSRASDLRDVRAYHGMTRALIDNMIVGVTKGYQKDLEIVGVGWNAAVAGNKVTLQVGFCNPIVITLPPSVQAASASPTSLSISGPDKQLVGAIAARIRSTRPPEPYKGKGVRYRGEYVRQKAGKSFGS